MSRQENLVKRTTARNTELTKKKIQVSIQEDLTVENEGPISKLRQAAILSAKRRQFSRLPRTSTGSATITRPLTVPTSLRTLGVSHSQQQVIPSQNSFAHAYYQAGIHFACENEIVNALEYLNLAWISNSKLFLDAAHLPILHKLYAALMLMMMHVRNKQQQSTEEFQELIGKVTNLNNILLHQKNPHTPLADVLIPTTFPQNNATFSSALAVTFFSPNKSDSQIINVSGFGNNCGLYALALGIKKYLMSNSYNPYLSENIKKIFYSMDEASLIRGTPLTEQYGRDLRAYLFSALLLNKEFKKNRRENFVAYVVTQLVGRESTPLDMQAFKLANQDFFMTVKQQWQLLLENMPTFSDVFEQVRQSCEVITVSSKQIIALEEQVKDSFGHVALTDEVIENFINTLWSAELKAVNSIFEKIILVRKLFDAMNFAVILNYKNDQARKNSLFKANLMQFITLQVVSYLQKINSNNTEHYKEELIRFALLADYTLYGPMKIEAYEIRKTICSYFVGQSILDQYETIYSNYCTHLRHKAEMLTADEIGCLATYFGVRVTIKFPNGNHYQSSEQVKLPQITLCNPTQDHWQVIVPNAAAIGQANLSMLTSAAMLVSDDENSILDEVTTESESEENDISIIVDKANNIIADEKTTDDESCMDADKGIRLSIYPT